MTKGLQLHVHLAYENKQLRTSKYDGMTVYIHFQVHCQKNMSFLDNPTLT